MQALMVPRWLLFAVAAVVTVFGVYRVWIAFGRSDDDPSVPHWQTRSAFGRTKRAHLIYGGLYCILGVMITLTGFGIKMPFVGACNPMPDKSDGASPKPPVASPHAPESP